jgi:hypothetical protein
MTAEGLPNDQCSHSPVDLTCVNKRLCSLERRADVGLGRDNARRDVLWSGPADPRTFAVVGA